MSSGITGYRIGWGLVVDLLGTYRRIVPLLLRGRQADGQRVRRAAFAKDLTRDTWRVLRQPRRWLHRPWQAEADGQRFARRAFTKTGAERAMAADVEHEFFHGVDSPWQTRRCRRADARRARAAAARVGGSGER